MTPVHFSVIFCSCLNDDNTGEKNSFSATERTQLILNILCVLIPKITFFRISSTSLQIAIYTAINFLTANISTF